MPQRTVRRRSPLLGPLLLAFGLSLLAPPGGVAQEPEADRDLRGELMLAVEMNDLRAAREAVRDGGDLEINFGNPSPLTTAVQLDLVPMVALLLELGGDPAITADRPLEVAVRNGSRDMVRLLLREGGARPPEDGERLAELFDFALRSGDLVILEELLYAGADADLALARAVADGDFDALMLALEYGASLSALPAGPELAAAVPLAEVDRFLEAARRGEASAAARLAESAAAAGDAELLERCFENGVEPGFEHLRNLAEGGHESLAVAFLERLGAEPGELLPRARESASPRLVRLLERRRGERWRRRLLPALLGIAVLAVAGLAWLVLRRRVFVSPRKLHDAVAQGDLPGTSRLLRAGADARSWREGHQPLHLAALNDDVRIARALLHHGAVAAGEDEGGELGQSPLHLAATVGSVPMAELLLRHGAAADATGADGLPPLYAAASAGHAELVHLLIERGADPNARGPGDESLLLAAVSARDLAAVRILLEAGADPNADRDRTPLHAAAAAGELELVEILLAHGASPAAADATGRTPLDLARLHRRDEVVARLEKLSRGA